MPARKNRPGKHGTATPLSPLKPQVPDKFWTFLTRKIRVDERMKPGAIHRYPLRFTTQILRLVAEGYLIRHDDDSEEFRVQVTSKFPLLAPHES